MGIVAVWRRFALGSYDEVGLGGGNAEVDGPNKGVEVDGTSCEVGNKADTCFHVVVVGSHVVDSLVVVGSHVVLGASGAHASVVVSASDVHASVVVSASDVQSADVALVLVLLVVVVSSSASSSELVVVCAVVVLGIASGLVLASLALASLATDTQDASPLSCHGTS